MKTNEMKNIILIMLRNREFYGYEINKQLSFQEININISRLYGILNDMQSEGLLLERWEKSETGPRRKIYRLSEKGKVALRSVLNEAISIVHLFYIDHLRDLYPEIDVFGPILQLVTDGLKAGDQVAYITDYFSGFHELIINRITNKIENGKVFLVSSKPSKLKVDSVNVFEGYVDDLPFKRNYLDLLVIVGVPFVNSIGSSIDEWKRTLTNNGRVLIIAPSILFKKHEEPLTIGDFVEKIEHHIIEKGEIVDSEIVLSSLKANFKTVKVEETVHMSFINAYN